MLTFTEFLNESFGVNEDVKKMTALIFDAVINNISILKSKKILIFKNLIQNNYSGFMFNDVFEFNVANNFKAGVIEQKENNNVIIELKIKFNVDLSNINRLRQIISHELTHVIEHLYSKKLSKDWNIYKKFTTHKEKYKNYKHWIIISDIFYDTLSNELRSRVSETYELLKSANTLDVGELKKVILSSPEYKKLNEIIKTKPENILKLIKQEYPNYNEILTDFMRNVFDQKYTDENFIKLFNNIKNKVRKQIKKLSRLISAILYEHSEYLEEYDPDSSVNYYEYLEKNLKKE